MSVGRAGREAVGDHQCNIDTAGCASRRDRVTTDCVEASTEIGAQQIRMARYGAARNAHMREAEIVEAGGYFRRVERCVHGIARLCVREREFHGLLGWQSGAGAAEGDACRRQFRQALPGVVRDHRAISASGPSSCSA